LVGHKATVSRPLRAQHDFPPRESVPDLLHVRDTKFLLLMVTGYVLAMLGGVVLLHALSPVSYVTTYITPDVQVSGR
jgi:hypothetical protein